MNRDVQMVIESDIKKNEIPDYGLLYACDSPFELKKIGKALIKTLPKTAILAIQNIDNLLAFTPNNEHIFSSVLRAKEKAQSEATFLGLYSITFSSKHYTLGIYYFPKKGCYCQLAPFNINRQNFADENALVHLEKLTKKETEVFSLYANGLKRSVIARELAVSVITYDNHLQSIRRKLNQTERQDLLMALQAKNSNNQ